ncbi:MAG TPA: hypothetical protein VFN10_12185 [Thermoanaerobaculia bacterium]|nr:hypothetical protein [Thermoanaerobaculia bacterium]
MDERTKIDLVPDRATVRLWVLLLVSPLAWAAHLQVSYALHMTACAAQNRLILLLVSFIALLVVGVNLWFSWTTWMAWPPLTSHGGSGGSEDEEPRWIGRSRFMAVCAFFGSIFFALVIIGQTIPMFVLRPCD